MSAGRRGGVTAQTHTRACDRERERAHLSMQEQPGGGLSIVVGADASVKIDDDDHCGYCAETRRAESAATSATRGDRMAAPRWRMRAARRPDVHVGPMGQPIMAGQFAARRRQPGSQTACQFMEKKKIMTMAA